MIYTNITPLPATPDRFGNPDVFSSRVDGWLSAFPQLKSELDTTGIYFEEHQATLGGYVDLSNTAVSQADDQVIVAASGATDAESAHTRSVAAADNADAYELSARDESILAASNAGIPSLSTHTMDLLFVAASETEVILKRADRAIVGDISRSPSGVLIQPAWLQCNGSVYDENIYTELYSVIGTAVLPSIAPVNDGSIFYYIKTGL